MAVFNILRISRPCIKWHCMSFVLGHSLSIWNPWKKSNHALPAGSLWVALQGAFPILFNKLCDIVLVAENLMLSLYSFILFWSSFYLSLRAMRPLRRWCYIYPSIIHAVAWLVLMVTFFINLLWVVNLYSKLTTNLYIILLCCSNDFFLQVYQVCIMQLAMLLPPSKILLLLVRVVYIQ